MRNSCLGLLLFFFSMNLTAEPGCHDANIFSGKLITDFCWSCLFPIRVSGISISGAGGTMPAGAVSVPICACPDSLGVPRVGTPVSMWEPARLIELQRVPGCSSVLGGKRVIPSDRLFQGHHGNGDFDGGDGSFMHYHYYSFPLHIMLNLAIKKNCNADGYMDLDLMYFSEIDPTWNNSELAFFTNPEVAIVANPVAALACMTDAASSALGKPIDSMFWCAGSWGSLYPLSGHQNGGKGVIRDSSLLTVRAIAALHRRGLAWKTMGAETMCRGVICPTLPKSQYKFSLLHPVPEAKSAHVIGESTLKWGLGKTIPAIGQDPVYTIWRWNDCCNY